MNVKDKLVTIAQYEDYIQAELAKQRLEDYGIKAVIVGQNAANIYSGLMAIKGPQLQVLQSCAQQAREILDQLNKADKSQSSEEQ